MNASMPPLPPSDPASTRAKAATAGGPGLRSGLVVTWELLAHADAAGIAVLARLQQRGVVVGCVHGDAGIAAYNARHGLQLQALPGALPLTPRLLLQALRSLRVDATASWLVTAYPTDIPAAATAGLGGVVVVAEQPGQSGEQGIWVQHARDLADVPRVLIPRDGGCWHQP